MSQETSRQRIFYGWFIVAALFAVTLTIGGSNWTFGVFVRPLESEFGWNRTLVSSGYTALLIGRAISLVTAGVLADRFTPRPILLVAAVLVGLGLSLCSQVSSINQFRIFLFIVGLGIGTNWTVPTTAIQRWFYGRRRAGLALGIVLAGVGMGALVFAPVINQLILSYGWRNAFLIIGLLFFGIIVLSSLVVRKSPAPTDAVPGQEIRAPQPAQAIGWTAGKVIISPAFIAIALIISIANMSAHVVTVHLVPHAADAGISATASAAAIGLMGGFTVPGRVTGGYLADRISWRRILALSSLGMALSLVWLIFLEATWMLYGFILFYGVFLGGNISASVGILSEFFGTRSLGKLIGITAAASFVAGAFATYMAGVIFDVMDSYFWAFIGLIALLVIGGLLAMILKRPEMPE